MWRYTLIFVVTYCYELYIIIARGNNKAVLAN